MCENKSTRKGIDLSDKKAHAADHSAWDRRSFLKTIGLAGASTFTLQTLPITSMFSATLANAFNGESGKKLVLIRLKGGNDGLNTFVPVYEYDLYKNLRPTLGHETSDLINLNNDFSMPTAMSDLLPLWQSDQMRVINSVGYPDHNLSHFTGADIMASGNSNPSENGDGWLARYFTGQYPDYIENPCDFPPAIKIGGPTSILFNDADKIDISANFASAEQLNDLAETGVLFNNTDAPDNCYYGEQVLFLRTIANAASIYSVSISDAYNNSVTEATYPASLGDQLKLVARLIKGGLETQFYLVTLDGFDTHVSQNGGGDHLGLLENLSSAVRAFYEDLAAGDADSDVLSMTYSEFGRRVEENGFAGTDHGTALPIMLFGPALEGAGFHGMDPDLTDLNSDGNLKFGTDFRSVYATILQEWLCLEATAVDDILGGQYDRLTDIGISCSTTSTQSVAGLTQAGFAHRLATLGAGEFQVILENPKAGKAKIELLTISGKRVKTIADQYVHPGVHYLPFSIAHLNIELAPMVYSVEMNGVRQVGKFLASSR
ncbi:MAG: DUF1501 domain-containing protein [Bacteroidota bacterium]